MNVLMWAALGSGIASVDVRSQVPVRRRLVTGRPHPGVAARPPAPRNRPAWLVPGLGGGSVTLLAAVGFGWSGAVVGGLTTPLIALWAARRPTTPHASDRVARSSLPLVLDLMAAALRAGAPTASALAAVGSAAPPALRVELRRTAALLRLGAGPGEAWSSLRRHPVLGSVALVAVRSADSGIRLAEGLERQAGDVRAEVQAAAITRANRVATLSLLPLGLCFLPAFILLGVVPIVVGVAGDAFASISP